MSEISSLNLVHWSAKPLGGVRDAEQFNTWHKPVGLWVSSEGNDDGWREWCNCEGFNLDHFAFRNEIKLRPDANILLIDTAAGIYDLTEKFPGEDSKRFFRKIDWSAIAKLYAGIVIAPYQWKCRLDDRTSWYYSWDCASGCIWNANAVSGIITEVAQPFEKAA